MRRKSSPFMAHLGSQTVRVFPDDAKKTVSVCTWKRFSVGKLRADARPAGKQERSRPGLRVEICFLSEANQGKGVTWVCRKQEEQGQDEGASRQESHKSKAHRSSPDLHQTGSSNPAPSKVFKAFCSKELATSRAAEMVPGKGWSHDGARVLQVCLQVRGLIQNSSFWLQKGVALGDCSIQLRCVLLWAHETCSSR